MQGDSGNWANQTQPATGQRSRRMAYQQHPLGSKGRTEPELRTVGEGTGDGKLQQGGERAGRGEGTDDGASRRGLEQAGGVPGTSAGTGAVERGGGQALRGPARKAAARSGLKACRRRGLEDEGQRGCPCGGTARRAARAGERAARQGRQGRWQPHHGVPAPGPAFSTTRLG